MPNVLILTEVQEAMRARYKAMLLERFPQLTINVVGHHNDVGPYIADVDILLCFSPPMADHVEDTRAAALIGLGTSVFHLVYPLGGEQQAQHVSRTRDALRSSVNPESAVQREDQQSEEQRGDHDSPHRIGELRRDVHDHDTRREEPNELDRELGERRGGEVLAQRVEHRQVWAGFFRVASLTRTTWPR